MKGAEPFGDQVSSGDSSSSYYSKGTCYNSHNFQVIFLKFPLRTQRGFVIRFTSWVGFAASMKEFYGQPLHYLTNVQMKKFDQMRLGADNEDVPLDTVINPSIAEATIWIIEEVHMCTSSHHYITRIWLVDPMYPRHVDANFPELPNSSKKILCQSIFIDLV
ncbi:hypothetical protein H5410_051284 [Solanum commersonii]|uniref:Uncharacterized protein n=1 Tax=Solanum commersonii TaxID=4109 RepID=A0A9J5WXS0_SOLCO|nr:hypothetical protein H5410_051284 [Solanum commersonii]